MNEKHTETAQSLWLFVLTMIVTTVIAIVTYTYKACLWVIDRLAPKAEQLTLQMKAKGWGQSNEQAA